MTTLYYDGKMIVIRACSLCREEFVVEQLMTELQYMDAATSPERIREIVPHAAPDFKDAMTTGACPPCRSVLFSPMTVDARCLANMLTR